MALPPGPSSTRTTQLAQWIFRPIEFMEQCTRTYGDCFTLKLLNNPTIVVVSHPATVKAIFTGDSAVLHAGEAAAILEPLVGDHSLLLLDGDRHLRERRLMLPPFHGARMKTYAEEMRIAMEREMAEWQSQDVIHLQKRFQQVTLEIILRTVFGVHELERMRQLGEELTRTLTMGASGLAWTSLLPGGRRMRTLFERQLETADQLIFEEIARRRAENVRTDDVMSLLMSAVDDQGESLSDQALRDQLMTLLVAGHETTATALSWTVHCLLSRRHTYDRLVAEIDRVVGDEAVTDTHLEQLPYLDAVVKESLRLRPVVPMVGRRLQLPMTVHGYDLPAGIAVGLNIYLTQRRADIYDEPNLFKPERFVDKRPDPYAWLPFGGGIRRCLGMAFALYEMKIVLASVLAHWDLHLLPGTSNRTWRRAITFIPAGGPKVRITARTTRRGTH